MKILISVLIFSSAFIFNADIPAIPNSVRTFYGGMEAMEESKDVKVVSELELDMLNCFEGARSSGISLPNDFKHFDYDKKDDSHNDSINTARTYIGKLKKYLYTERAMKVECGEMKSEWGGALPDMSKNGRLTSDYAIIYTYVKKTYTLGGETLTFNDIVATDSKTGLILEIRNELNDRSTDLNSLKNKAAEYYLLEQYNEAYKCYEQIVSLYPDDGDSYYRLAIMTYFRQGCEYKFRKKKKEAKKKATRYMELAEVKGDYIISNKAEIVLHYWEYPNQ